MENDREYINFFSSEFADTFVNYSERMVRYAVSGISAACEIIDDVQKNNGSSEEIAEMTKTIMGICRKLMRMARLGYVLREATNFKSIDLDTIDADSFAEDFVRSCNIILGGRCEVTVSGRLNCSFKTSRELIAFFMLSHIRRILKSFDSCRRIVLSLESVKKQVKITIAAEGASYAQAGKNERFDDASAVFAAEIAEIFEEKFKLGCEYDEGRLSFYLPRYTCAGEITFESSEAEMGSERFSDMQIMLSDIDIMHETD